MALAYATVSGNGTLDPDRSWGVTQVFKSQVGPGLYCVRVDDAVAPLLDEATWLAGPLGVMSPVVPLAVAQNRDLGGSWCPIPHPTLGENWIGVRTYELTTTGPQAADWGFTIAVM